MKKLTHAQVKSRQAQAVRMLTDVVEPPDLDRADQIASMTPQQYADHRGFELVGNPNTRRSSMPSKADLEEQVMELESEVAELQDALDAVADIAAPPEEEDGEGEEEGNPE